MSVDLDEHCCTRTHVSPNTILLFTHDTLLTTISRAKFFSTSSRQLSKQRLCPACMVNLHTTSKVANTINRNVWEFTVTQRLVESSIFPEKIAIFLLELLRVILVMRVVIYEVVRGGLTESTRVTPRGFDLSSSLDISTKEKDANAERSIFGRASRRNVPNDTLMGTGTSSVMEISTGENGSNPLVIENTPAVLFAEPCTPVLRLL